ncbi:MAG TPA: type II toxin-antitoxin system PemK/MazF family toxin [Thermoanaerobaculia bacterium]|nr:type II toxin-antitoxin system PemK/MazF family toxin [Thermoanaerobaculia bacterium]
MDLGMTAKVRPCLVVSAPIGDTDRAIVTLVPHTTSTRGTQFEAAVRTHFLKPGAFDAQGIITVPSNWAIRLLGTLETQQVRQVEVVLCRWLELPCPV